MMRFSILTISTLALAASVLIVGCGDKGGGNSGPATPVPGVSPQGVSVAPGTNIINGLSTDIVQGKILNRQFALTAAIGTETPNGNSCQDLYSSDRSGSEPYFPTQSTMDFRGRLGMAFNFDGQGVLTVSVQDLGGNKISNPIYPAVGAAQQNASASATYSLDGATQSITIGQFSITGNLSPRLRTAILAKGGVYERNQKARSMGNILGVNSEISTLPTGANGTGFDPNFNPAQGVPAGANPWFSTPVAINQAITADNLGANYSQYIVERLTARIFNTIRNRQHILGISSQSFKARIEDLATDDQSTQKCLVSYDLNLQKLVLQ